MIKSMRATTVFLSTIATSLLPAAAQATTFAGTGGTWAFVNPVNGLAAAISGIAAAVVVIAIVVIVGQHMVHREDWGGMVRNIIFTLIGGAVVVTASNFLTNAGVTGALIR